MKNIHENLWMTLNLPRKSRLAKLTTFALIAGGLMGCVTASDLENEFAPSSTPQTVDQLQLNDKRAEIGAKQHPRIVASYGGEYRDVNASKMIARVVGVLTTVSENPIQSYRITILDSPSVNAFALPGGYLYITRGILALANDEAEIAAVISHEMAHVIANHGIQRQQQQDAALIAGQVVSEILSGNLSTSTVLARNRLRLAAFSRQQELQADEIGIRMLAQAGYDPNASVRFLKSLESFSAFNAEDQVASGLNFLSSHPSTPKRLAAAQKYADQFASGSTKVTNRTNFLRDINGLTFGDNAQHGYVRGNTFLHANLGIRFDVPLNFEIDNTSDAVLANGPNEIATQFDAVEIKVGSTLDTYINDGWIKGLDPSSVARTTINGLPALTARAQADRWIFDVTLIQYNEFYYRFLTAAPKNKERHLSVAKEISGSFRALSQNEVANLRPLRIRTVEVRSGETISSIASRMLGTNRKIELFRVLNALQPGAELPQGAVVKIISE